MASDHEPTAHRAGDTPPEGADRADHLLDQHLQQSDTVGAVRRHTNAVLAEVDGDHEAKARVHEYQHALHEAGSGHDHVQLEQMHGGQQGENRVGTHASKANTNLFAADDLIECTEITTEVLDHEDEEVTGHAGQIAGRLGLVLDDGDVIEGTEMYEGEVESQQGRKQRGSAQATRDGQPEQDYGSGQRKVAPRLRAFERYLRDGVDRAEVQAELMRGRSRRHVAEVLHGSRMYAPDEIDRIVTLAA